MIHLHNHTQYSMLDGLPSTNEYIEVIKENKMSGMAITDHGNLHGVIEFYRAMKENNLHPIIGSELYQTPFGIKNTEKERTASHLLLLAKTQKGYDNLVQLSSLSFINGFYYKPRTDIFDLENYCDGLITTTGCMAAHVPNALLNNRPDVAEDIFKWYKDRFGDNYYVELQVHPGISALNKINKTLIELAKKYSTKIIITNDCHYAKASDAATHDALLCIQTNALISQPISVNKEKGSRFGFTDNHYYLKSRQEMIDLFLPYANIDEINTWIAETEKIAANCNANPAIDISPKIPEITDKSNSIVQLATLAKIGLKEKFGDDWESNEEIKRRYHEEIEVIKQTGFAQYFLIIHDIIQYAISQNIVWNTRGSAAGSLINYVIGISHVDPVKNNLLFSRYLNTFRVSIPDCDLDFPDTDREKITKYIIEKWGEDRVCQVVTFNKMKARSSIRDVARVMGVGQKIGDKIAASILNTPGKPITLENSLDPSSSYYSKEFRELYDHDQTARKIIDMASGLEDKIRQSGIHAAALLISPKPLNTYIPLMRGKVTKYASQFDYPTCESIGLLKVDLLGLASLRIINTACNIINSKYGTNYNYWNIPYEDKSSYEILSEGNCIGIFQVESPGLRKTLKKMQPSTFGHIADAISLYRPGPMHYIETYIAVMQGKKEPVYKYDALRPILEDTQGIMIYQEQINLVLVELAGYELGEADKIRKAISKKDVKAIAEAEKTFIDRCLAKKIDHKTAKDIFADIGEFALYGFNRAHAASYARLTLITAWLKSNYTIEYLLACLQVEGDDETKRIKYVEDCKYNGIKVLPPKFGNLDWKANKNKIIFGLSSIKGIGEGIASKLALANNAEEAMQLALKKDQIESLVYAGCFDDICPREYIIGNIEAFVEYIQKIGKLKSNGQEFLVYPEFQSNLTSDIRSVAVKEWEVLGAWIKFNPLDSIKQTLSSLDDISEMSEGEVKIIGVITSIETRTAKFGEMIKFKLTDKSGSVDCVMFGQNTIKEMDIVSVGGYYNEDIIKVKKVEKVK